MPRPSVIPQVRERLEVYLNEREVEYQAQSDNQKTATLPSTPDGKINVRAIAQAINLKVTPSLHKLLSLLPEGARVLFAGDEAQLPPVGIGKVFYDLVMEGSRVAQLTRVLRQAEDSKIPKESACVRQGHAPKLNIWNGETKGVFLVQPADREIVLRRLRASGELLVVAATKATVSDINETESSLRRQPSTLTRRLSPLARVAVGDPVVTTVNRYQDGLFNGLLGVVISIDGPNVAILWDGELDARALPSEAEGDVELAYAITCHKAQGSSSQAVVVVVEKSGLVTREWLYTAITRGRELVLLIGTVDALEQAVRRRSVRITGFTVPAR